MASSKLSLKLLIDTKGRRVLFAEADKKTVDFLFHILTLSMATVIKLLTKQQMVGCLANLYDSVENQNKRYIQSSQTKDMLLKPITLIDDVTNFSNPIFALPSGQFKKKSNVSYTCSNRWMHGHCGYYKSNDQKLYFSYEFGATCPKCNEVMSMEMSNVSPTATVAAKKQRAGTEGEDEEEKGGFVKGFMNYMVMDDLVVKPMSTISSIALLNAQSSIAHVRDIGSLEERVVDVGFNEISEFYDALDAQFKAKIEHLIGDQNCGFSKILRLIKALELLKTSLASKEVLTFVFLKNEIPK